MFGLFKKTRWKIVGKAFAFFNTLFSQLPEEYHFLSEGLRKGLYKRYSVNFALKGHHYTIGYDPSQSDKSMTKGKQFELQDFRDSKLSCAIVAYLIRRTERHAANSGLAQASACWPRRFNKDI